MIEFWYTMGRMVTDLPASALEPFRGKSLVRDSTGRGIVLDRASDVRPAQDFLEALFRHPVSLAVVGEFVLSLNVEAFWNALINHKNSHGAKPDMAPYPDEFYIAIGAAVLGDAYKEGVDPWERGRAYGLTGEHLDRYVEIRNDKVITDSFLDIYNSRWSANCELSPVLYNENYIHPTLSA